MKTPLAPFHRVFKDKTSGNKKFLSSEYLTHGKLAIVDQGQSTVAGFTDEIEASCKIKLPCVIFGDHTKKFQFQEKPFALGADGVKALEIARDVDPKYAYYAISLFRFPDGTGYSRHFKFLKEARISLPDDIAEQRRIADILDKADAIRRKRQQSLKLIDELVKSQFIEMFGDPVKNPMGWEVKSIEEFSIVKIGPFGSLLHAEDYIENGVPLINPSHIIDEKIRPDISLTISSQKFQAMPAYALRKNDVVLGRRGEIGRCAVVGDGEFLCGTGSMYIRVEHSYHPLVLQKILAHESMRALLTDKAVGITMKNLNAGIIAKQLVPRPPIALQNEFARFAEQADKSKFAMQRQLREIEILSSALKQKFFA